MGREIQRLVSTREPTAEQLEVGRAALDEILTPDSSRYWKASSYASRHAAGEEPESLDKEFLRLWISSRCDPYKQPIPEIPADTLVAFAQKYIALYETVTGRTFQAPPADEAVKDRIRRNLAKFMK
jgi:phosphoribosylaminoimidazole-succinocarboxamide synthase